MLTLLKKPSEDSEPASPAWHPDFRNNQRLPDTKVVRTSFLISGAALLVAGVLLISFAYQAYELRELNAQVDQWQQQIDRDAGPSAKAIALYKKFQSESARANEVNAFIKSRPILSEILLRLGETLPDYIALDLLNLDATSVDIRGTVRGAPDQASGRASTYLQLLKSDAFFIERFAEVNMVSLNRDIQNGGLILEVSLKLKPEKKP